MAWLQTCPILTKAGISTGSLAGADICTKCPEKKCVLQLREYHKLIVKRQVQKDYYIQCPHCHAVEELSFRNEKLEGQELEDMVISGKWAQFIQSKELIHQPCGTVAGKVRIRIAEYNEL